MRNGYRGLQDKERTYQIAAGGLSLTFAVFSFFGPFYGDYRIMLLDPDYQWALIGGSSDKFLWILSRTPQLGDSYYPKRRFNKAVAYAYRNITLSNGNDSRSNH